MRGKDSVKGGGKWHPREDGKDLPRANHEKEKERNMKGGGFLVYIYI